VNGIPVRILQLNSMLKGGGTDDQCVKLAAGLRKLGQQVWIAGPDGRQFSTAIREFGIPFHATPTSKPGFIFSAAKFARREKIQIIHSHHGRDIWRTVIAAKLSGVRPKIIFTRHMAISPSSWLSRHFMLAQCDALIAVSDFVAKVLREGVYEPDSPEPQRRARLPIFGDHSKIRVAHGGIDTEKFRPADATEQRRAWGLAPEHFAFVVAGAYNLPRGKGQREFLQAAAQIHEAVPHARFLIVGRGNLETILKTDIERLGLRGKAWLTPYCTDMPAAMNAMDCLVHPPIGTEAFALVVCEAHACGKPVIASALDGVPEAFACGGYGQLVKPESVSELAAAMRDWATRQKLNEAQRIELHQKVAAKVSLDLAAQRVLEIYQSVLR
jgi:glycosyltransferase involved in cell wall biosynthesis